jgi:hypothetical protein
VCAGTLENTPADWLAYGSEARQGYAGDTFALGLCVLHLFTGHAPYEEIMADVSCPPELKRRLLALWRGRGEDGVGEGAFPGDDDEGDSDDSDDGGDGGEGGGSGGRSGGEQEWFSPVKRILRVCEGADTTLPDTL